jgi:hypothetical protein
MIVMVVVMMVVGRVVISRASRINLERKTGIRVGVEIVGKAGLDGKSACQRQDGEHTFR